MADLIKIISIGLLSGAGIWTIASLLGYFVLNWFRLIQE